MTKKFSLFLAGAIALSLMVSCGVTGVSEDKSSDTATATEVYSLSTSITGTDLSDDTTLSDAEIVVEATSEDGEVVTETFGIKDVIEMKLKKGEWTFKIKILVGDTVVLEGECTLKEGNKKHPEAVAWGEHHGGLDATDDVTHPEDMTSDFTDLSDDCHRPHDMTNDFCDLTSDHHRPKRPADVTDDATTDLSL